MENNFKWFFPIFPVFSVIVLWLGTKKYFKRFILVSSVLSFILVAVSLWVVGFSGYPYKYLIAAILILYGAMTPGVIYLPVSLNRATKKWVESYREKFAPVDEQCQRLALNCGEEESLIDKTSSHLDRVVSRYSLARNLAAYFDEGMIFSELNSIFSVRSEIKGWFYGERESARSWKIAHLDEGKLLSEGVKRADIMRILEAISPKEDASLVLSSGGELFSVNDQVELAVCPVKQEKKVGSILGAVTKKTDGKRMLSDMVVYSQLLGMHLRRAYLFSCVIERSRRDGLTGLFLRRVLLERISEEIILTKRYGTSFSVIMVDIDHFKKVNDRLGHPAGDVVLKGIAETLKSCLHPGITLGRYGGEEFIALVGLAPHEEVMRIAESIRAAVEEKVFRFENADIKVTLSAGVAHYSPEIISAQNCIDRADQALYKAKNSGRNKVWEWKPCDFL